MLLLNDDTSLQNYTVSHLRITQHELSPYMIYSSSQTCQRNCEIFKFQTMHWLQLKGIL